MGPAAAFVLLWGAISSEPTDGVFSKWAGRDTPHSSDAASRRSAGFLPKPAASD